MQRTLLSSQNGPILPNRDMNIDFSTTQNNANNAFNAIRNMNLLPSPSSNLSTPQSVLSMPYSPMSSATSQHTFDDNMSLRSSQSAQYNVNNHRLRAPNHFIPDSPSSISSLPVRRRRRKRKKQQNKQQYLSSSNYNRRKIMSANNTPITKKQRKKVRRSRSHSRFRSNSQNASNQPSNFKVIVRVRPPLRRELESPLGFAYVVRTDSEEKSVCITDEVGFGNANFHKFTFDEVYPEEAEQSYVYETTAKHSVLSALTGYNASIIAYGQTSAGKTYTMEGFEDERLRGIIPRAIEEIFDFIEQRASPTMRFLVRASYLQIYNDNISDLLKCDRTNLQIREDKKKGVYVAGLSEWVVRSCQEIYGLIKRGSSVRTTCATKLNEISSRSHAIFIIIVEQNEITIDEQTGEQLNNIKIGKLNLVDLAGSERVRISGAEGQRLEESKNINQSLSALGNVISALTDSQRGRRAHIPYRDSKLTRILEDSLGGNCKTTMMAMISPALEHYSETVSTLKFANRAKNIKNMAVINQDLNEKALLRKYEKELKRLKAELRDKSNWDESKLMELQQQKMKAEQDKMTAIGYLERIAQDLSREKQQKQALLAQIATMNEQQQRQMPGSSLDYEEKIREIEVRRSNVEEDKAQVQRYKQLLMKQRDIMIQLTSRLNERDQSILALQEELDHYDNEQQAMENVLDAKTVQLKKDQIVFNASDETQPHIASPYKNPFIDSPSPQKVKIAATASLKLQQSQKKKEEDSLEYLLRVRINDMVQKEVDLAVKKQENELNEWRQKYENAEERRRNSEYLLELSRVGGKASILHKQLTVILQKERQKVEEQFHSKIAELKRMLLAKDEKLLKQVDNKTVFDELKKLKMLHNKFSKMHQKVVCDDDGIANNRKEENGKENIINSIIKNENLSDLVCDLKLLHSQSSAQGNEGLKDSIEIKIKSVVESLKNKVLNEQNGNSQTVKNDIIHAQKIINHSFDLLNCK